MRVPRRLLLVGVLVAGLPALRQAQAQDGTPTLLQARKGHKTRLTSAAQAVAVLPAPPEDEFELLEYPGPLGAMGAYVTPDPGDGERHPAIVWIVGGFPPGCDGATAWERAPVTNDQSAGQYRRAGIVMMFPSFRGSGGNPGRQESFYGEVDDVIAAAKHLRSLDYVDPKRVYLGGHSTGGTLALLVAECTNVFRGVIAFGPVTSPANYGAEALTYDPDNAKENDLRSPVEFVGGITTPTWAIEGDGGNIDSLRALAQASTNPKLRCVTIAGANHFDVLAPVNRVIADRIVALSGPEPLDLDAAALQRAFDAQHRATREADALDTLAALRRAGVELDKPQTARHYLLSRDRAALAKAATAAKTDGFDVRPITEQKDRDGDAYFVLVLAKRLTPSDLKAVFATAASIEKLARGHDLQYDGWNVE